MVKWRGALLSGTMLVKVNPPVCSYKAVNALENLPCLGQ
jgi:hypothetical protein